MIHNIISSIWHNKWRSILIVVLMTITYFLSLITITNSLGFFMQLNEIKNMFSTDTHNIYRVDASNIESPENIGVDFYELKAFVNGQNDCYCGAYYITGSFFDELENNTEFIELNKKEYLGTKKEPVPSCIDVVFFDPEILHIVDTQFKESDFLKIEKEGNEYLPIYVGQDFKSILNIGDILTLSRTEEKYIIMGFLNNTNWLNGNDPITMPLVSLDHMFFAPFSAIDQVDSITQESTISKILMICSEDISKSFTKKAIDKGIKFRTTSIFEFTEQYIDNNMEIIRINVFLAIIVIICSSISIISTLCVTVLLNKKEYGIRLAYSSSIEHIILTLSFETILLNIISSMIALFICYKKYSSLIIDSFRSVYLKTLFLYASPLLLFLMFILLTIVLIVPITILRRYDPAILIKEDG